VEMRGSLTITLPCDSVDTRYLCGAAIIPYLVKG
jgi:hypothetical protein